MPDEINKRVDESWKEQAQREKETIARQQPPPAPAAPTGPSAVERPAARPEPEATAEASPESLQARFDLLISSLAMEALIAMGDMVHPATHKQNVNLPQARYLIDLIGILDEKTAGNLTVDEDRLLKDTLYQLRMRYLAKEQGR